jgi:hypothetical protein
LTALGRATVASQTLVRTAKNGASPIAFAAIFV